MDPNATDLETADLVLQTSLQEVEEALRLLDRDTNDGRAQVRDEKFALLHWRAELRGRMTLQDLRAALQISRESRLDQAAMLQGIHDPEVNEAPAAHIQPAGSAPPQPQVPGQPLATRQPQAPGQPPASGQSRAPSHPHAPTQPKVPSQPQGTRQPQAPTQSKVPGQPQGTRQPHAPTQSKVPGQPQGTRQPPATCLRQAPTQPKVPGQLQGTRQPQGTYQPRAPTQPKVPSQPPPTYQPRALNQPKLPSQPPPTYQPRAPNQPKLPSQPQGTRQPQAPTQPKVPGQPQGTRQPQAHTQPKVPGQPQGTRQPPATIQAPAPGQPQEPQPQQSCGTSALTLSPNAQTQTRKRVHAMTTATVPPSGVLRECVACSESYPESGMIRSSCSHIYCQGCVTHLLQNSLADESLFPPRCCRLPLPLEASRAIIDADLWARFEEKKIEHGDKHRTYCSDPDCSRYILPSHVRGTIGTCRVCNRQTCTLCKNIAHRGECVDDRIEVLKLGKAKGWQRCLNWSHLVELRSGCNHITCRCRHEFCYVCSTPWKQCKCAHWDEAMLQERAELIAARNQRAPPAPQTVEQAAQFLIELHMLQERAELIAARIQPAPPAPQIVEQAAQFLIEQHDCYHDGAWKKLGLSAECEECGDFMPDYIFECRHCGIQACNSCRIHRF